MKNVFLKNVNQYGDGPFGRTQMMRIFFGTRALNCTSVFKFGSPYGKTVTSRTPELRFRLVVIIPLTKSLRNLVNFLHAFVKTFSELGKSVSVPQNP